MLPTARSGKAGERLLKRLGRVDILVNNAGLNVVNRRLTEITAEDWDYILAVNLTGAFNMVQAAMLAAALGGQRLRMAPYVTGRNPRTERAGNS